MTWFGGGEFCESGGFARRARLPNLFELALSTGESSVVTVYSDASSLQGWGATLGDHFIQGKWSKLERREGINWMELCVLNRVLETWCPLLRASWSLPGWTTAQRRRTPTMAQVGWPSRRASQGR